MKETRALQETVVPVSFVASDKRHLVLIAAILASALGFIDGSVLAIALPAIRESLGAGLAEAQWIYSGYMLMLSAFVLTGGALGDRLGLGRSFAGGIAGFVAASVLCALAQTPDQMIVARVLQGLGAAVMVPGSLAAITRAYPRAERGAAIGLWAASSSLTTALGPLLGGVFLSYGGAEAWRFIFAINLPLGALAIWLIVAHTRDTQRDATTKIDFTGGALASAALFFIAFAFTQAEPRYGLLGAAVFGVFLWHEARCPAPMIDVRLFRVRDFSAVNLATLLMWMGFQGVLFYLPMTLIAGWEQDALITSLTFAPMALFIALLSPRMGRLADRIGPKPLIAAGAGVTAFGFLALSVAIVSEQFFLGILPATSLVGLGLGLAVAPLTTAVVNSVPDDSAGTASGVNNAAARVAGLMGVATLGLLAEAGYRAAGGQDSFGAFSQSTAHGASMITGFQAVAYGAALFALLGAVVVWFGMGRQASSSASQ
ncbi:MFS transporter [uncultured Lentibacter sp.]|uniref:MFS transporter n=1 Tax=uncultured Lentibacter sp. TaxID=1659309 RepID=UPI00263565B5|nr:MFS transporter [uncultured Lentibacter sp.]